MWCSALRRISPYALSLAIAACGAGDGSAPSLPTSAEAERPSAPASSPGISMPVTSEGTQPAGFRAVFRVDPKPDTDGIIHGDSPLTVEFDLCSSSSGAGGALSYLYDWDFDHVANVVGTGDACRKEHTYNLRRVPGVRGNVILDTNVCVVSGNPRVHGPGTYFSCRTFRISLPVRPESGPSFACAQFILPNTPLPAFATGSTTGAPNTINPSCGASNAGDNIYQFTAPATATYSFDTFGSGYDTVLAVFDGCGGAELACSGDGTPTALTQVGVPSQVTVPLMAGQTVIVVVDGFGSASGFYHLRAIAN